jgi:hypothetical protein
MTASFRAVAHAAGTLGADPVCNVPAGVQNGDLLLAFCVSTVAAWTPPAGWTAHPNSAGGVAPLFQRIASSEPANYTFGASGSGNNMTTIVAIKDVAPSTPAEVAGNSGVVGSGNIVLPTITTSGANRLLLQMVCRAGGGGTFTPPGTATERYDAVVAPTTFTSAGGDEVVGSGATGTRTWVPSSSGTAIGYIVSIAPLPPEEGTFAGAYDFTGSGFNGLAGPGEGGFTGAYDFTGSGFAGEINPEGEFVGGYDFSGSNFVGVAGAPSAYGFFNGGFDFSADPLTGFTGVTPSDAELYPGGRDRFTARRTPKNRRRSR